MVRFILSLTFILSAAQSLAALQELNPLDVVPEIVAIGIQPKVQKISIKKLSRLSDPLDQYYLNIKIGSVSPEQFIQLKALYGNLSQVPYEAQKNYNLIDFLPPVIQATVNHSFFSRNYNTDKLDPRKLKTDEDREAFWGIMKNGVSFFTNCWNTTIETLRFLNTTNLPPQNLYTIRWPGRWEADDMLKSDDFSAEVESQNAQFGDAMLISQISPAGEEFTMLQHSALVLGNNLVFEKTDGSKDDPFRLSLRSDVVEKYNHIFEKELSIKFRRYGGSKKPLPADFPREEFTAKQKRFLTQVNPFIPLDRLSAGCDSGMGGGCDPMVTEFDQAEIVINPKTGRGELAGKKSLIKRFVSFTPSESW
jgi:hypothetical protein